MRIINQLSELYKKLRLNDFATHNEESQAMVKSNELEREFKKNVFKKEEAEGKIGTRIKRYG